mmetsp:Transcript_36725/g.83077  ORF Transcript_36725/g.83077 Transcript_36725/m.83077 type:complete len:257 (-) Transcript_36725:134-904(-)
MPDAMSLRSLRARPRSGRLLAAVFAVALGAWSLLGDAFVPGTGMGSQLPAPGQLAAVGRGEAKTARQFFDGILGGSKEEEVLEDVIIKEDYTLAAVFGVLGAGLCAVLPYAGLGLGGLCLALAVLFFVQTGRVRFAFDKDSFELRTLGDDKELKGPGENIVVGGKNRWAYSSFVNYEFFPQGLIEKGLPPILVYFKETQTPKEEWGVGPGEAANSEDALAKGAVPGMVHFFPAICDAQQIKAEFERRGCKKIASSP